MHTTRLRAGGDNILQLFFISFFDPFLQEGGIVALFKICRQDCFRCLYPQTLRTLASICCVEEGIQQLEKVLSFQL